MSSEFNYLSAYYLIMLSSADFQVDLSEINLKAVWQKQVLRKSMGSNFYSN